MTSRVSRKILLIFAVLAVFIGAAVTQGRGQGNSDNQKDKGRLEKDHGDLSRNQNNEKSNGIMKHKTRKHRARNQAKVPVFGNRERDIIGGYYQNQNSNLPPGLAKRDGNLPPGLQKQLQRNGTLPPGLQKRLQPFPLELTRQLPRLPANYTYGVVDGSAVIINSRTRAIIDVIQNVLNRTGV
jgi:hypothetical protein